MTFTLDSIKKGGERLPPRIIFYGPEGIGKTLWASQAPDAIFIPTEDGSGKLDIASFPQVTKFEDAIEACRTLYKEKHSYKTVVIDTLSRLEQMAQAEVRAEYNNKKDGDIFANYGRGYKFVPPYFDNLIRALNALRNKGMMVLVLAHSQIKRFESPEVPAYDRYVLNCHEAVRDMMYQWCDAMLFANYKTYTTVEKGAFNSEKHKGTGNGQRVILTEERPTHQAKNRFELQYELAFGKPFDWKGLLQGIGTMPKGVIEETEKTEGETNNG